MFNSITNSSLNFIKSSVSYEVLSNGRKTVGDLLVGTIIANAGVGTILATAGSIQAVKAFRRGEIKRGLVLSSAALATGAIAAATLYFSYQSAYSELVSVRTKTSNIEYAKYVEAWKKQYEEGTLPENVSVEACPYIGCDFVNKFNDYSINLASLRNRGLCLPTPIPDSAIKCADKGMLTVCTLDPDYRICNPDTYQYM